jgi:diaminopimelate decarboxylase
MDEARGYSPPVPGFSLDAGQVSALKTPCYVFDPARVQTDYAQLRAALGTPLIVSLKANPNIDLLMRCSHVFADGVELASLGELNIAFGRITAPKYVNTPALDSNLLAAATGAQAISILDSLQQVSLAVAHATNSGKTFGVGLRINAASLLGSSARARNADHFGMEVESLHTAMRNIAAAGLSLKGLHVFSGSNSFGKQSIALANRAGELLDELSPQLTKPLDFVNLGGGFSEDWTASDPVFCQYRESLDPLCRRWPIIHEAGRAVFAHGGAFVTRVVQVKHLNGNTVAICDGGIAHCFRLAMTEHLFKQRTAPRLLRLKDFTPASAVSALRFAGNSCSMADIIGELWDCAPPQPGDVVLFDRCGAYHTYSPTGFLNLQAARQYLLS